MSDTPIYYPYDPISIRDATVDQLKTISAIKTVAYGRTMPSTDMPLPFATVFFSGDEASASEFGQANTGAPHFSHRLKLDIVVMCNASNEMQLDDNICLLVEQVKKSLLRSTDWLQMFEAVPSMRIEFAYPEKEEEYTVEAIITFVCEYRSIWSPIVENYLDEIVTVPWPTNRSPILIAAMSRTASISKSAALS